MQTIEVGYDLSSLTFSPEGRLIQIEYASKMISQSLPTIGLVCKDGLIIISVQKNKDHKMAFDNVSNIHHLNKNTLISGTGYISDVYFVMERIRIENRNHIKTFSDYLEGKSLVIKLCCFLHLYTLYWHLRPLACSFIIGTISSNFLHIFLIFLSGFYIKCFGGVLGNNAELIKIELENLVVKSFSCKKSIELIVHLLKKLNTNEYDKILEISWFSKEEYFTSYNFSCNMFNQNKRTYMNTK